MNNNFSDSVCAYRQQMIHPNLKSVLKLFGMNYLDYQRFFFLIRTVYKFAQLETDGLTCLSQQPFHIFHNQTNSVFSSCDPFMLCKDIMQSVCTLSHSSTVFEQIAFTYPH